MKAHLRKITVNVPAAVLSRAQELTGAGVTPTIVHALLELERGAKRSALRRLKGRVRFQLDIEDTRR